MNPGIQFHKSKVDLKTVLLPPRRSPEEKAEETSVAKET